MPSAKDVYINADELDTLPALNKENYIYETEFLQQRLPDNATVLQVGSMDGVRIIRLLQLRPDLKITGLELEEELVDLANKHVAESNITAQFIAGDITDPPHLPNFDYVICLNNTLGYIPDEQKAIEEMKKLGKDVIISVYGEKFDDELAQEYFANLNLAIERIEDNIFVMKDFTRVKRYTRDEVSAWGGKLHETPIGYLSIIKSNLYPTITFLRTLK